MSKEKFSFNILHENNLSRVGQICTSRGNIDTPTFMPVGTQGTIKSAFIDDVVDVAFVLFALLLRLCLLLLLLLLLLPLEPFLLSCLIKLF